ncbi:MAG: adenylyltransferase/cytidyltransferase family protein [Candidatus Azambacteria bacterium]|nr:adenylyltransferase/cytidyltransferase family protein [Candidatus Azambacteria bacterium]
MKNKSNIIIGYAYVCADLMHAGHLEHLEFCKKFCDRLIVGVLTDKAVMEKKPKPIFSFEERLRLIQALECVDIAVPQETYSPLNNAPVMADILFESADHEKEAIEEAKLTMSNLGKRVIVDIFRPHHSGRPSSTAIKSKIKKEWKGGVDFCKK